MGPIGGDRRAQPTYENWLFKLHQLLVPMYDYQESFHGDRGPCYGMGSMNCVVSVSMGMHVNTDSNITRLIYRKGLVRRLGDYNWVWRESTSRKHHTFCDIILKAYITSCALKFCMCCVTSKWEKPMPISCVITVLKVSPTNSTWNASLN